jgi:molybdopterin synthase catalytic subunit
VIFAGLTAEPLDAGAIVARVSDDGAGAVVVFEGRTRSPSRGRDVVRLSYEAFEERATKQLDHFAREIAERPGVRGVAAVHRTGDVSVGEPSVVVVVCAEHREAAFAGARDLIDRIKAEAAIWKKEVFAGGDAWVGVPE